MNKETTAEMKISNVLAFTIPSNEVMAWLHDRLESSADERGILDVAYKTIDTPVGSLLLAATKKGLLRVAFQVEGFDEVLELLARKVSQRILKAPKRLDTAAFEIDEYFARTRTRFDLPLDFSLSSGFRQVVQRHLPNIAYGQTTSYQHVAALVGNPRAVRAVGTACAKNPLPIVVPCHRVLRSDGGLGGYAGGLAVKSALLQLENAR